jgi:virginiamycin B lyase
MPSLQTRAKNKRRAAMKKILVALIILMIIFGSLAAYFFILGTKSSSSSCIPTINSASTTPYISEFGVINNESTPNAITVDSQGNVWFVIWNESDLGVLYSSNSSLQTFQIPMHTTYSIQSWGIVVDNSRHLVWFGDDTDDYIWKFNMTNEQFTGYNVTRPDLAFPQQVVLDSSGNLWYAESNANKIGEITTSGQFNQYPLPTGLANVAYGGPVGLTMQTNGTFWFSDTNANSIGSLTVSSNNNYTFHVYNMTGKVTEPVGIAVDQQGNVWMTEHGPSLVAEFSPATGYFRSITTHIPPAPLYYSLPYFVYVDTSGNVWFNEHQGNAIGRFSPSNDSLVEYMIPTKIASAQNLAGAITMTLAPDGTPWFTEWFSGKIGTVHLSVPVNVSLTIQNSSVNSGSSVPLSSKTSVDLKINIESIQSSNRSNLAIYLSNSDLSNHTIGYSCSFSPTGGNGNYTSELTIRDRGLAAGTYYFTVSVATSDLIISKIIEVNAT